MCAFAFHAQDAYTKAFTNVNTRKFGQNIAQFLNWEKKKFPHPQTRLTVD